MIAKLTKSGTKKRNCSSVSLTSYTKEFFLLLALPSIVLLVGVEERGVCAGVCVGVPLGVLSGDSGGDRACVEDADDDAENGSEEPWEKESVDPCDVNESVDPSDVNESVETCDEYASEAYSGWANSAWAYSWWAYRGSEQPENVGVRAMSCVGVAGGVMGPWVEWGNSQCNESIFMVTGGVVPVWATTKGEGVNRGRERHSRGFTQH